MEKTEFSRMITLLRKEKGISQKKAANDLGISQALLSHYEKGIRECGLHFVIRCAEYYKVSCDYLLGFSAEKNGHRLHLEELSEMNEVQNSRIHPQELAVIYHKKLIFNSLNILFDFLKKAKNKKFIESVCSFLSLSVYRMFRVIYSANKNNKEEMFQMQKSLANATAEAVMNINEATALTITQNKQTKEYGKIEEPEKLSISMELLDAIYQKDKSALLNLIKNCETRLASLNFK